MINIPFAIGLTIDDMGWRLCRDDKKNGGPPRLHGTEDPRPEFYKKLAEMGKACGTRPQGSFVMSEFDRENACGKPCYNKPLAPIDITEFGLNWRNEVSPCWAEVMNLLKEENGFFEFGLHGVRHGHFTEGKFYESEWASRPLRDEKDRFATNQTKVEPWDKENKTAQTIIDCYEEILRQYFTKEELSFPESFAPPHHVLYYDKNNITTGAFLSKKGVKYCNAKITGGVKLECPIPKEGVIDHGMHILDRRSLRGVPFDDSAHTPIAFPRKFPWIEAHFRDFWYTEMKWANYLYHINSKRNYMLAKNTEQVHSQYFYNKYAKIYNYPKKVIIDTKNIPREAYDNDLLSSLVLKLPLGKKQHISEIKLSHGLCLCGYYKDIFGFAYLTIGSKEIMGRVPKSSFEIMYKVGKTPLDFYVDNSMDTYNIYELGEKLRVKIYGTQTLRIKTKKKDFKSDLNILNSYYEEGFLYIAIKAKSMNGDVGEIMFYD